MVHVFTVLHDEKSGRKQTKNFPLCMPVIVKLCSDEIVENEKYTKVSQIIEKLLNSNLNQFPQLPRSKSS
jgi:hypothetical protein